MAGAQGCADCEFPSAPGRARKQEIGDVDARNKQDEADGTQQNAKEGDVANHVLLEWNQGDSGVLIGVRICFRQDLGDAVHIGTCLRQCHSGFQPRNGVHAHADAPIENCGIGPLPNGHVGVAKPKIITHEKESLLE